MKKSILILTIAVATMFASCQSKVEKAAEQITKLNKEKVGATMQEEIYISQKQLEILNGLTPEECKEVGKLAKF
jgi:protein involved in sex pheromone biosynthesis